MKNRILAASLIVLPCPLFAADSDGDGLDDSVETNTGIYVSPTNTGTNPNQADSDGDGAGDWYEIAIIDVAPTAPQPNSPNSAAIKPNVPYPLPAPDASTGATNKPVKVYILSGQSNMVGQGSIGPLGTPGTLETITKSENKFPNLLNGANWSVRRDVKYRGVIAATGNSDLIPGYNNGSTLMGPEFGFGHVMGYHHDEPVLILKSSEGGRALGWDFLPPGSMPFAVGGTTYAGYGDSPASWVTGSTPVPTGFYGGYQFDQCFKRRTDWAPAGAANPVVTNAATVLDNFATEYPQWAAQGFEIAGFGWFHGWNDGLSSTSAYANRYEQNMAQFIRQIRAYYESRFPGKIRPKAPFVIATAAFEGWDEAYLNQYPTRRAVLNAQHAVSNDPVKYPDLFGNVKTMEARGFWRDKSISPVPAGTQGYHYNRHAETFMLVGDALGRGMIDLLAAATPDTLAPFITGLSPLDNATDLAANTNLVITFNEAIATGTGNITIRNLTDATQSTISITDSSQVSIDGAFLTINPAADLAGGKSHAVRIDAGALKDLSNNAFAGISDDTTWNFTTVAPDLTPPAVVTLSPADNAGGVPVGANLGVTFSEPVVLGSGKITIRNLSNSTQRTIPVTDASQVSLNGTVLSVNPSANLAGNSNLAIRIDAGVVKDLSNNPFAGINDDTTWNFSTAFPPTSAEISLVGAPVEGFLNSAKSGFATTHLGTTQISYNAAGVDKLIVAIGTEAGNNGQRVNSVSVSFKGDTVAQATPMTLVVQDNTMNPAPGQTGAWDGGYAGIFQLDNPFQGPGTFTFSASTSSGAPNGAHVTIIGLAGTRPGAGNTGANWHTQTASGNVSTSLITSAAKSLVIGMVENSGRNNGAGTPALAAGSPMTLAHNGNWGSQWGSAASGYQFVPASGTTVTPTFNTNAGGNIHVVAAEFKASEVTPDAYASWSAQYPSADLTDPSADPDRGGLPTGIEWIVGGDPANGADDAGRAPSFNNSNPDHFVFTYRRRDAAHADPDTTIAAQYGSGLGSWTTATHGVNGVTIDDSSVPEAGFRTVVVSIPKSIAGPTGRLFARLKAGIANP